MIISDLSYLEVVAEADNLEGGSDCAPCYGEKDSWHQPEHPSPSWGGCGCWQPPSCYPSEPSHPSKSEPECY